MRAADGAPDAHFALVLGAEAAAAADKHVTLYAKKGLLRPASDTGGGALGYADWAPCPRRGEGVSVLHIR